MSTAVNNPPQVQGVFTVSIVNVSKVIARVSPIVSVALYAISMISGLYGFISGCEGVVAAAKKKVIVHGSDASKGGYSLLRRIKNGAFRALEKSFIAMKENILRAACGLSTFAGAVMGLIYAIRNFKNSLSKLFSGLLKASGICFLIASSISLIKNIYSAYLEYKKYSELSKKGDKASIEKAKIAKERMRSHIFQGIGDLLCIGGYISIFVSTGGVAQGIGTALIAVGSILSIVFSLLHYGSKKTDATLKRVKEQQSIIIRGRSSQKLMPLRA